MLDARANSDGFRCALPILRGRELQYDGCVGWVEARCAETHHFLTGMKLQRRLDLRPEMKNGEESLAVFFYRYASYFLRRIAPKPSMPRPSSASVSGAGTACAVIQS